MAKVRILVVLALLLAAAMARDDWCANDAHDENDEDDHDSHENDEDDHDSHEDEMAHPEDFLRQLFMRYGENSTCTISEQKFEKLLEDLQIGEESEDSHSSHSAERRRKRAVDHTCYSAEELLDIYNVSHEVGVTQTQFSALAAALVQQVVQGCVDEHEESHDDELSTAQVYGYGTLSVVIVTLCAPLGLIIVRWEKSASYKYIMAAMLGLAVSALSGDALIHLIPHGIGLHDHEEHSHETGGIEVDEFVWKTSVACAAIWLFFNIQLLISSLANKRVKKYAKEGESSDARRQDNCSVPPQNGKSGTASHSDNDFNMSNHREKTKNGDESYGGGYIDNDREKGIIEDVKADSSLGWMVTFGDGIHNFVDGMAIGAAYTVTWQTGVSTTIAVFIHELAHEFGDCAALLSVGWSWKCVFFLQVLAQVPAFVGLYIGIPVSENSDEAQQWILCVAAGMFLYIALCDIVPELMLYTRNYGPVRMAACINLGLLLGYGAMLIIAVFEEQIVV